MSDPVRVMIEQGKKKTVASAFDWPGWDRSAKSEEEALEVARHVSTTIRKGGGAGWPLERVPLDRGVGGG